MKRNSSGADIAMGKATSDLVEKDREGNIEIPDVHIAAETAILTGAGAIATSGGVAAGAGGVAVGGDVGGNVLVTGDANHTVIIPYDTAFERVVGSTAFVLNQLEMSYRQTREQAQGWFRFSLTAAGIGFILIGLGVVAVIFGQVTAGLITAISSVVPNAASALFFIQSRAANERVDAIQVKLTEAREIQTAVEITNTISDLKSRDKLKAEIVRKALRIQNKPNDK